MNTRRQQRGFVLQTILGAIVVLVVAGTFLYVRTHEYLLMSSSVRFQTIAASRATLGVELTIAKLKQVAPPEMQAMLPCRLSESLDTCAASGRRYQYPVVDNGDSVDLGASGGWQYQVDVYIRTNDAGLQPQLLLVSTGYYGYGSSPNRLSSQLQVELTMPANGLSGCSGYCGAN